MNDQGSAGNQHEAARLGADELVAYFTLIEVGNLLPHAVAQQLREDGDLSPVQFQILVTLDAAEEPQRMTDLADRMVHSRSGITYQAGQLEARGLVTRGRGGEDERSMLVQVTDAGRSLVAGVLTGHVELVRRLVFASMTDVDVAGLQAILGSVRDRLRAAPPRSARPRAARRET